jgi:hypothetical protein
MKTYFQLHEELTLDGEILDPTSMLQTLEEKAVILGKGQAEGQAVILAGGAGSGKTFVANNFMEGGKFKMINPDDIKEIILSIRDKNLAAEIEGKIGMRLTPSVQALVSTHRNTKLSVPRDAGALHGDIKRINLDTKRSLAVFKEPIERLERSSRAMGGMFKAAPLADVSKVVMDPKASSSAAGLTKRLPNVMFDSSMRSIDHLTASDPNDPGILLLLRQAGYRPENIHLVWVLTDYRMAYRQNLTRSRVMGADIFLSSHRGVSGTMSSVIFDSYKRLGINGDLVILVGGRHMQIQYEAGTHHDWKGNSFTVPQTIILNPTTADFKYFRLKKAGSTELNPNALQAAKKFLETVTPSPSETKETLESSQIKRIMLDFRNIERIVSDSILKGVPTWKILSVIRKKYPFAFDGSLKKATANEMGLTRGQYLPLLSKATALIVGLKPDQFRMRTDSSTDSHAERIAFEMSMGSRSVGFKSAMSSLDSLGKSLRSKET